MKKEYHYLYKITNILNGMYYYGIHSTDDLNDGYMGSGTYLMSEQKRLGVENFKKEILEFRDTRDEISQLESEIVTEDLVNDHMCYNLILGGETCTTLGTATMKDKNGNIHQVPIDSDKYYNMVGATKGFVNVYDSIKHKNVQISKEEFNENKERYNGPTLGKIVVFDTVEKKHKLIEKDEYYLNKERYIFFTHNKVLVIIDGEYKFVSKEEYRNGDFKTVWSGKHHTEETKQKMSSIHKSLATQVGEKNSQYGTCWVKKNGENKRIKKEELDQYINDGWAKGVDYGRCWVNKNGEDKFIKKEELDQYINDGWVKGMYSNKTPKRVWVNNGVSNKHIQKHLLQKYINTGWKLGKI